MGVGSECIYLDGVNTYIKTPHIISGLDVVTVEAWVKLLSVAGDRALFGKWGTNQQILLYHDAPNGWRFLILDSGAVVRDTGYGSVAVVDTFYHIVGVFDKDGSISLFVNAALDAEDSIAPVGDPIVTDTNDLYIGIDDDLTRDTKGYLDEIRIYGRAMGITEIGYNYNGGQGNSIPYDKTDLLLWLRLTEGAGAAVADSSGQGNNGAINGVASWKQFAVWDFFTWA